MEAAAVGKIGEDGMSAPAGPVAVVGLGAMGSRIARRLHASGEEVVVWSRTPEKAVPFAGMSGGAVASSPAEAAARAGTVIVTVSDQPALSAVTEGPGGIAAGTLMLAAVGSAGRELRLLPAVRSWLADAEQHGRGEQDYTAVLAAILDGAAGRRAG